MVKNPPTNAGDTRNAGLIPGSEDPLGNPLQYSWLGNSTMRGAWQAPGHGVTESDTTDRLSRHNHNSRRNSDKPFIISWSSETPLITPLPPCAHTPPLSTQVCRDSCSEPSPCDPGQRASPLSLHLLTCEMGRAVVAFTSGGSVMCCAQPIQSCLILCDPMDCSPPDTSAHGVLQARVLERVAMPSSRGSS